MSVYQNISECIGNTPMVKLSHMSRYVNCDVYAKCEFMNPGGSVKDRIAYAMIKDAERQNIIAPGSTLIEPSSGNAGIGIAMVGAALGYKVIITMPDKMSMEKENILRCLGAEVIRTKTELPFDHPDSHIGVANRLCKEIPNSHMLNQYVNSNNPGAHYECTASELLRAFPDGIKMLVAGAGTGGTISGIAKRLKETDDSVEIVGVDPIGSILAGDGKIENYLVEGIGYDFIPDVLNREMVDVWYKSSDEESFLCAREAMRLDGVLCGGSSGAALSGVKAKARHLDKGDICVVILPDSLRNYLSKINNYLGEEGVNETNSVSHSWLQNGEQLRDAEQLGV